MQKGDSPARGANGGPQGRPRPTRRPDLRRDLVQRVDKQRERKENKEVNFSCTTGTSERRNSVGTKKSSLSHPPNRVPNNSRLHLLSRRQEGPVRFLEFETSSLCRDPLGERAQIECHPLPGVQAPPRSAPEPPSKCPRNPRTGAATASWCAANPHHRQLSHGANWPPPRSPAARRANHLARRKWVGGKHRARGICRCCLVSSSRRRGAPPSAFLRSDR